METDEQKFCFGRELQYITLRVNNRCGNGTGSFDVKIGSNTTQFTNVIITRLR